jgi:hypothetical protein
MPVFRSRATQLPLATSRGALPGGLCLRHMAFRNGEVDMQMHTEAAGLTMPGIDISSEPGHLSLLARSHELFRCLTKQAPRCKTRPMLRTISHRLSMLIIAMRPKFIIQPHSKHSNCHKHSRHRHHRSRHLQRARASVACRARPSGLL